MSGRTRYDDRTCSVEDCETPWMARSLCGKHYAQAQKGLIEMPPRAPYVNKGKICSVDDCETPAYCQEFCRLHYSRVQAHGDPHIKLRPWIDYDLNIRHGPAHHSWKGSDITYGSAHQRVANARGRAKDHGCVECGERAVHWAYNGMDTAQLYGPGTNGGMSFYSADPNFYDPMCRRCHDAMDSAQWRLLRSWMQATGTTLPALLKMVGADIP